MDALYRRMERAVGNAQIVFEDEPPYCPSDLADFPDDHPVRMTVPLADFVDEVMSPINDGQEGWRRLMEVYFEVAHGACTGSDRAYIEETIEHEREHVDAAVSLLGAYAYRFAVQAVLEYDQFGRSRSSAQPTIYFGLDTTKFGAATIAARPRRPSIGDMELIRRRYGYPNIETITDIALQRNAVLKPGENEYPVPLSAQRPPSRSLHSGVVFHPAQSSNAVSYRRMRTK